MNPPLQTNDRILLLHMEGESAVTPGTKGTVSHIGRDPFDEDEQIISVLWDNGSTLSLLSSTDAWKKIKEDKINEASLPSDYMAFKRNKDIFDNFDWRTLREFLYKIRESGIVNMLEASPLIYSGGKHIERYYGEGREDDEKFQELIEAADDAKDIFVQGLIKYMISKDLDVNDMDKVNLYARKLSKGILDIYIGFA